MSFATVSPAHARGVLIAAALTLVPAAESQAQAPAGLAASALGNPSFRWIHREIPGFRVYFLRDSYPAAHQDSLLARLPPALAHARELIDASPLTAPIDLFFIESRSQMAALAGFGATGFADPPNRTVLLVTNPEWRAFERHEIMHVVAQEAWGSPGADAAWLQEGLAQASDGRCAGYTNAEVALALARRRGWIPFDLVLHRFREQPDLRAYLQAAAFTDYLLRKYGPEPVRRLWEDGAAAGSIVSALPLAAIERSWRKQLRPHSRIDPHLMTRVESKGCG
jgi:hypothetical protein